MYHFLHIYIYTFFTSILKSVSKCINKNFTDYESQEILMENLKKYILIFINREFLHLKTIIYIFFFIYEVMKSGKNKEVSYIKKVKCPSS